MFRRTTLHIPTDRNPGAFSYAWFKLVGKSGVDAKTDLGLGMLENTAILEF